MLVKTFFFMAVLLVFGNPSDTKSNYHRAYYETGTTKYEGWLKQGLKTGFWIFYHKNGAVSKKGYYKNGKRIKYWYFYGQNGLRSKEGHYENDRKANWWLYYDTRGRIKRKCQLRAGVKNGYCLQYSNQKLKSAEKYQNGKKTKEWFSFSSFRRENNISDLK